jgi:hypothetical protein
VSDFYPDRVSEPDLRRTPVRFVGGTTAVTKVLGRGITVTYISTGIVDLVWSSRDDAPGVFCGLEGAPSFQATTASQVKGYTCVPGGYNSTTRTLRLNITNASETLADLTATQWLNLVVQFKASDAS